MEEITGHDEDSASSSSNSASARRSSDKRVLKKSCELSCKSKRSVKRKLKTFSFGRWQRGFNKGKVKNFSLNRDKCQSSVSIVSESSLDGVTCMCTGYRKTKVVSSGRRVVVKVEEEASQSLSDEEVNNAVELAVPGPSSYQYNFHQSDPDEASDQANENVPNAAAAAAVASNEQQASIALNHINMDQLTLAITTHLGLSNISLSHNPFIRRYSELALPYNPMMSSQLYPVSAHTQIDYVHHLVPALQEITNCTFYWGKMDRYKAEEQLDKKPEGTFLLRDSAQEEFLFSVSFRRYERTLHARVEQMNHKFSFDSHDPNVFSATTVCGLLEHYKNPRCCMFFEPMLTIPVHRKFPFSLSHICRAVISDHITYDNINKLRLPKKIKSFLKEYHYKQKVKVRNLEHDV